MHTLIPTVVSANLSLAADATMFPGIYTTPDGAAMSVDGNLTPSALNTSAGVTVFLTNGAKHRTFIG